MPTTKSVLTSFVTLASVNPVAALGGLAHIGLAAGAALEYSDVFRAVMARVMAAAVINRVLFMVPPDGVERGSSGESYLEPA